MHPFIPSPFPIDKLEMYHDPTMPFGFATHARSDVTRPNTRDQVHSLKQMD